MGEHVQLFLSPCTQSSVPSLCVRQHCCSRHISNCCSCRVRGWRNTLRGKHYPLSCTWVSLQTPTVDWCSSDWQRRWSMSLSISNFAFLWYCWDLSQWSHDDITSMCVAHLPPLTGSLWCHEHIFRWLIYGGVKDEVITLAPCHDSNQLLIVSQLIIVWIIVVSFAYLK